MNQLSEFQLSIISKNLDEQYVNLIVGQWAEYPWRNSYTKKMFQTDVQKWVDDIGLQIYRIVDECDKNFLGYCLEAGKRPFKNVEYVLVKPTKAMQLA